MCKPKLPSKKKIASCFASHEFYPFAENEVTILSWLFTSVLVAKEIIPG